MLATGEAPCSPAVAVAELLIIFRRLLDATPCKVTLELPGELEHEPALQALALSAVGVAVLDGAALPLSQSTALAPLATSVAEGGGTALWRSLGAAARVRIWQGLLPLRHRGARGVAHAARHLDRRLAGRRPRASSGSGSRAARTHSTRARSKSPPAILIGAFGFC